jgi:rod shape determining protein RodA
MLIMAKIDYCHVLKYTHYLYALAVLGMLAVLIFGVGEEEVGRGSWIRIPVINISIQPSEIVKILYIVCLSKRINSVKENINRPKNIIFTVLYAGIILVLVIIDNLGSALVFMFATLCMLFVAGVSMWYFFALIAIIVPLSPIIWKFLEPYQQFRILVMINPELDPLGFGWQVGQSMKAIGTGGLSGVGFQQGYITQNKFLPKQQTDFIFATAGEEFGFLGALLAIILLTLIILRVFYVSRRARNDVGSLMCVGVLGIFMAQSIVSIGMCFAMMPVIGITLPFFSYGGSSILSCYMAVGIVLSVYSRRNIYYFRRGDDFDISEEELFEENEIRKLDW